MHCLGGFLMLLVMDRWYPAPSAVPAMSLDGHLSGEMESNCLRCSICPKRIGEHIILSFLIYILLMIYIKKETFTYFVCLELLAILCQIKSLYLYIIKILNNSWEGLKILLYMRVPNMFSWISSSNCVSCA